MSKKAFSMPFIIASGLNPGEGPGPGPGSAQGSTDIEPYSWEMWQWMFEEDDSDGNGTPGEWSDYVAWMTNNGFSDFIDWNEEPEP